MLSTGEIETLITNLKKEDFSKEDLNNIYSQRWCIKQIITNLKKV